jgi:hypothetical protein
MCGCTKCVGLHTLHRSLQAKHGVMHCQFELDAQHRTRKVQAVEKARGWGAVAWQPTPLLAIMAGTCPQWSSHAVPHWKGQMLQCANCKEYPFPREEAREDANTEDISFHVYKYKVSLCKDCKEQRWLELVWQSAKIGEFHHLYYWPVLGRGQYRFTKLHFGSVLLEGEADDQARQRQHPPRLQ